MNILKKIILMLCFCIVVLNVNSQNYKKGFKELEGDNYGEAVVLFDEILDQNENDAIANFALGLIYSDSEFQGFDLITAFDFLNQADKFKNDISQKNLEKYEEYFSIYLIGETYKRVDKKLSDLVLGNLQDSVSTAEYLKKCKGSQFYDEIVGSYDDYNFAKARNSLWISEVDDFVSSYPESKHVNEAKQNLAELLLWKKIQEDLNIDDINAYHDSYPDGRFTKTVDSLKVEAAWNSIDENPSIAELQIFLNEFVDSKYVEQARDLIEVLKIEYIKQDIAKYSRNNQVLNKFSFDPKGNLCLSYKEVLYRKCNLAGDCWDRVYGDHQLQSFSFSLVNNAIYRVVDGESVEKSLDAGKNWITINNGLPDRIGITSIFVKPEDDVIFIITDKGLYRTTDSGFFWERVFDGQLRQIASCPNEQNLIFALVANNTILYSSDNGNTWLNSKIAENLKAKNYNNYPILISGIYCFPDKSGLNLLAATNYGLFLNDRVNYQQWENIDGNLLAGKNVSSMFCDNEEIVIATFAVKNGEIINKDIYRTELPTFSFEKIDVDLSKFEKITGIAKSYDAEGYFISSNAQIGYVSDQTLIGLNYGVLPHSDIRDFVLDSKERIFYAMLNNTNDSDTQEYGVWKSTDLVSWDMIYSVSAFYGIESGNISISPNNSGEIWVTHKEERERGKYAVSYNDGATWSDLDNYPDYKYEIEDVQFSAENDDIVYFRAGKYADMLVRYDKKTKGATELRNSTGFLISRNDDKKIFNFNLGNWPDATYEVSNDGGWLFNPILKNIQNILPGLNFNDISFANSSSIIPHSYHNDCIIFSIAINNDVHGIIISYLLKSEDNGGSWEITKRLENTLFKFVQVDPNNNEILFGATYHDPKWYDGKKKKPSYYIALSADGNNWREFPVPENLGYPSGGFKMKVDDKIVIYLFGDKGLHRSEDGKTWKRIGGIEVENE